MTTGYRVLETGSGVLQIWDAMGVGMTLFAGSERALLFDTGYGLWDTEGLIRSLTDKPLTVLLSHAHHDHALGALRLGGEVLLHPADLPHWPVYTDRAQRKRVFDAARDKDPAPDGWATQNYVNAPEPRVKPLEAKGFDLGGLRLEVLHLPGHTPGSIGLLCKEKGILAAADSWNPQTWVFFPECCDLATYRQSLRSLRHLPYDRVLVSHDPEPRNASYLHAYIDGLSDETLDGAKPWIIVGHEGIRTARCFPAPGSPLIFDHDKWRTTYDD